MGNLSAAGPLWRKLITSDRKSQSIDDASDRSFQLQSLEPRMLLSATIEVTAYHDISANDGVTTLREAINIAAGDDVIVLGAGQYTLDSNLAINDAFRTITITGVDPASTTIAATGSSNIFSVIDGLLDISSVTLTGGDFANGGAIFNNRGTVTITDTVLTNNAAYNGGAIANHSGIVNINSSTLYSNVAAYQGGAINNDLGGVINITNSTFSGNQAEIAGAINNVDGVINIASATVATNTANIGGGIANNFAIVNLQNSIVANNTGSFFDNDISGSVTSLGSNLIGDTGEAPPPFPEPEPLPLGDPIPLGFEDPGFPEPDTGGGYLPSDILDVDPMLAPLADNGGMTPTHALLDGSLAIDAGDNTLAPAVDQRGLARPVDGDGDAIAIADIGAYEVQLETQPPDDSINGTEGDDTIKGTSGDDVINGLDGDDTLKGKTGDDTLDGGDGNDTVQGGQGDDTLAGGEGDDLLKGGAGSDTLQGDAGSDTLKGGSGDDTLLGGSGDDLLKGGSGDDSIYGGEGDDTLKGGSGDDSLSGGEGDDLLKGGQGDDLLAGGDGSDELRGGAGNDEINGGSGDDEMNGGSGIDTAVFNGYFDNYTIDTNAKGNGTVTDNMNMTGDDGVDTIRSIEILQFLDATLELVDGEWVAVGGAL